MRYTLMVGLLMCMPTVALLAVAASAILAGKLRHRLARRHPRLPAVEPEGESRVVHHIV